MHPQRITLLVLAVLGTLTTFMPWAEISYFGVIDGTKGVGWISFVLFLAIIVLALIGKKVELVSKGVMISIIVLSLLCFFLGIFELFNIGSAASEVNNNPFAGVFGMKVEIKYGIYALMAIGFFLPATFLIFREKKAAAV